MITFNASGTHIQRHLHWALAPRWVVGGLFALTLLAYLALIPVPRADGQLIGSDGVGYYIYARSLVIDGDLDFTNEYAYFRGAFTEPPPTPLGLPGNKLAVGPALLWLPFFLVAHAIALLANGLGAPIQPDGFGYLYQAAISVGSIVYGAWGFALALGSARKLFGATAATAATAALWLGGNAIYYMVFEPSMSHADALFGVALLLSLWLTRIKDVHTPRMSDFALLGTAGGLVVLVRVQDGIFLLLPYGYLVFRWLITLRGPDRTAAGRWLAGGLLTALCTLLVFLPQIIVWHQLYGTVLTSPYVNDHDPAFFWLQPQIFSVLFSTFHGLFSWHPVYLLALVGLIINRQRLGWLFWALLGLLALNIYLVAAWWAWWQGDSFGGRMFLSATWIWVIGLSALFGWIGERQTVRRAAVALVLILVLWNGLALAQYRLGFVPMGQPLTWQQMTVDRLRLPWTVASRLLN